VGAPLGFGSMLDSFPLGYGGGSMLRFFGQPNSPILCPFSLEANVPRELRLGAHPD